MAYLTLGVCAAAGCDGRQCGVRWHWATRRDREPGGVCDETGNTEGDNEVSYHSRQERHRPRHLPDLLPAPRARGWQEGEWALYVSSQVTAVSARVSSSRGISVYDLPGVINCLSTCSPQQHVWKSALSVAEVPRRQPNRRSGLATLPSVEAIP